MPIRTVEEARRWRNTLNDVTNTLTDEEALAAKKLYDVWMVGVEYAADKRVRYEDTLFKCLTAHTSQDTWTPDAAPSLWVRVDDPSVEWPEWVQPLGATDAYAKGAKVSHNDKKWTSDVDSNTWEPGVYGWTEYIESE